MVMKPCSTNKPNIVWHQHAVTHNERVKHKQQQPVVLWFTGLSGAGKSSIANAVERQLLAQGKHSYLLDGDNIRHGLNQDLGFSSTDRDENIRRIGEVAQLFVDSGMIVLTAFISPQIKHRQQVRNLFAVGQFIEIYIDTLLEECEMRDPKGLYKKARAGEIKHFTGINSDYQPPVNPELHLVTGQLSIEACASKIVQYLSQHGYLA